MPAPGGLFATGEWIETPYGPVPAGATTWAGCHLVGHRPVGWALLVEGTIAAAHLDPPVSPLIHYRGRYRGLA
jgi:flavin reductase (DIM6/NTAB) family NADH-FMN oxidoreductase RutF